MGIVSCYDQIVADMIEALGLKNVIDLKIKFEVGSIPVIETTFYVLEEHARSLTEIFKRYNIYLKEEERAKDELPASKTETN